MKRYQVGVGAVISGVAMALSSCGELNEPLVSSGAMLLTPALSPGGITKGNAGMFIRNFHAIHVGLATQEQRRVAERRAQEALKSSKVKAKVKEKNVRYVAVPVKREKGQKSSGGTTVMKVNAETGKPTGEVFEAKDQGTVKSGDTIRLGGDPTLYFASTGDKV